MDSPNEDSGVNVKEIRKRFQQCTGATDLRPSSAGRADRFTTTTTNVRPSSAGRVDRFTTPTTKVRLSSAGRVDRFTTPTTNVHPSSAGRADRFTTPTTKVRLSSAGRVDRFTTPTTNVRPSSAGRVPKGPAKPARQQRRSKINNSELFKEPQLLLARDEKTGKMRCYDNTILLLSDLSLNVALNVVAITGLYRTGKSYLFNKLAGEKAGFEVGNTVRACTKGIWIWCRHHPTQDNQVLVLMDVEGLGDSEKVYQREDTWLFTLATVLSSTLVYNNKGTLDSYALDRLNFLEEIDSTIQVSDHEEKKKLLQLDFFFPTLVITLRDFHMKLVNQSGESVNPDQYLDNLLTCVKGEGRGVEAYNKVRLLIRSYFNKRKCFVFVTPCNPAQENDLATLPDKDLATDFLHSMEKFSECILSMKPLQLKSGHKINGRMFANLALHFVHSISEEKKPSILKATKHMVEVENQIAVSNASDIYQKQMQVCIGKMGDINPKDEALVKFHKQCLAAALAYFKQAVVFDDEDIFMGKATGACKNLLDKFKRICDQNSQKSCMTAIARLDKRIEKKLKSGAYACKSGYDEYKKDIVWIQKQYSKMTGLGTQSKAILQGYLEGKQNEEELVRKLVLSSTTDLGKQESTMMRSYSKKRRQEQLDSLQATNWQPQPFVPEVENKVEKIEDDMNKELEEHCNDGLMRIHKNYIDNLQLKVKELERQKIEALQNSMTATDIETQISYFQKVLETAKTHALGDTEDNGHETPGSTKKDKTKKKTNCSLQ